MMPNTAMPGTWVAFIFSHYVWWHFWVLKYYNYGAIQKMQSDARAQKYYRPPPGGLQVAQAKSSCQNYGIKSILCDRLFCFLFFPSSFFSLYFYYISMFSFFLSLSISVFMNDFQRCLYIEHYDNIILCLFSSVLQDGWPDQMLWQLFQGAGKKPSKRPVSNMWVSKIQKSKKCLHQCPIAIKFQGKDIFDPLPPALMKVYTEKMAGKKSKGNLFKYIHPWLD